MLSDESEFDSGEDCLDDGDSSDCDYGLSEWCVDPFLRNIGNCFECDLYLDGLEPIDEEKEEIEQQVRNPT